MIPSLSDVFYFLAGAAGVLFCLALVFKCLSELARFLLVSARRPWSRFYVLVATIVVGTLFGVLGAMVYVKEQPDPLSAVIGGIVAVGAYIGWRAYSDAQLIAP